MPPRRPDPTKWVWCIMVLSSGPAWSLVSGVTVRPPEKIPSTIVAQAKFFQDFFSVQLSPYKIEFGHVCEDPDTWEQRYEKKDFKNHRDMGKIRWGDKKGGYGEHYWDLNHAGHAGNQEDDEYDDDSDYNEEIQDYPETEEISNNEREEYYPDASEYERSARPKRENPKVELNSHKGEKNYEKERRSIEKRSNTEPIKIKRSTVRGENHDRYLKKIPLKDNRQRYLRQYDQETHRPSDKNHKVAVDHKVKDNYEDTVKAELSNFVPYEVSADERRIYRQVAPASVPRLFLESSTGHVIDRATGRAYVLQRVGAS